MVCLNGIWLFFSRQRIYFKIFVLVNCDGKWLKLPAYHAVLIFFNAGWIVRKYFSMSQEWLNYSTPETSLVTASDLFRVWVNHASESSRLKKVVEWENGYGRKCCLMLRLVLNFYIFKSIFKSWLYSKTFELPIAF